MVVPTAVKRLHCPLELPLPATPLWGQGQSSTPVHKACLAWGHGWHWKGMLASRRGLDLKQFCWSDVTAAVRTSLQHVALWFWNQGPSSGLP